MSIKDRVGRQKKLGIVRTFKITVQGIRDRLFRSAVTVAVIAVAMMFMMNVMTESLVKRAVRRAAEERTAQRRLAAYWATKLTVAGSLQQIIEETAQAGPGDAAYREAMFFGALDDEEMRAYHRGVRKTMVYLTFFDELKYGHRRQLIHDAQGIGVFDKLQQEEAVAAFRRAMRTVKSIHFLTSQEEFAVFLAEWPEIKAVTARVRTGRTRAVNYISARLGERSIMEALTQAGGDFGVQIEKAGFVLTEDTAEKLAYQAGQNQDILYLEETAIKSDLRKYIAASFDMLPDDVSVQTLWEFVSSRKRAERFIERMQGLSLWRAGLTVERLRELAEYKTKDMALKKALKVTAGVGGGVIGIGRRMSWLLFLSMLVSVIGISNAMLMSVTERFRDIATLKCLGAMDSFIMLSYVYEGCLLGLAGGILGTLIGSIVGLGRMSATIGTMMFSAIPYGYLFMTMAFSVVLGVLLSAMASIYPSLKAARLSPMEAMRIR